MKGLCFLGGDWASVKRFGLVRRARKVPDITGSGVLADRVT